jgi:hypothetical protein
MTQRRVSDAVSGIEYPASSIEHLFVLHPESWILHPTSTPPPVVDTGSISGHNLTSFKGVPETDPAAGKRRHHAPTTKGGCS